MAEYAVLTADQGTDTIFQLELVDSDRLAKDLTNITVSAKYKKSYNSTTAYAFTSFIPFPKTDGIIELSLNGADTKNISAGRYVYDVELKNADDVTERILEGILEINQGVTLSDTA
jgi:hypothetical protein